MIQGSLDGLHRLLRELRAHNSRNVSELADDAFKGNRTQTRVFIKLGLGLRLIVAGAVPRYEKLDASERRPLFAYRITKRGKLVLKWLLKYELEMLGATPNRPIGQATIWRFPRYRRAYASTGRKFARVRMTANR